jgi:hypothetical protein
MIEPLQIVQELKEFQLAASLSRRASIRSVRLVESTVQSTLEYDALKFPLDIHLDVGRFESSVKKNSLRVNIRFIYTVTDTSPEPVKAFHVDCRFQSIYDLDPQYKPARKEIVAFREGNAVFNCWPYFREYVQHCAMRADFPSVPPVSFLRVQVKPPSHAKAGAEGRHKAVKPQKARSATKRGRSKARKKRA